MDLLKQIDQLEEKLNIKGYRNSQIWVQDLDNQNFDIKRFFTSHFYQDKKVDYTKINQSMELVQNIQKETFEQIAVQVDMNLDKYVQICNQFDTMKEYFNTTDQLYKNIVEKMQKSKDSCQDQIKKVNEILENYNIVCEFSDNLTVLKKLISYNKNISQNIKQIQDFFQNKTQQNQMLQQFPGFKILNTCKLLNECKSIFKSVIELNNETRELSQKYNLVGILNEQATTIIQIMDQFLDKKLQEFLLHIRENSQLNNVQLYRQIQVIFNALSILNQTKLAEKKVTDIFIKPQLDSIFQKAIKNKTNSQPGPQQSKQRSMTIQIISEGIRAFVDQEYSKLLQIFQNQNQQQQNTENKKQFQVLNYDFIKLLWEEFYKQMVSKEMIFLYSVGIPDAFHLNYTFSMLILKYIKSQYKSKNDQKLLYESELRFHEKWNLQTYFQMRQTEIVKSFEQEMQSNLQKLDIQGEQHSQQVIKVLLKYTDLVLAKQIFIDKIGFNFIKLVLLITKKYSISLEEYAQKNNIKNISLINGLCTLQKEIPDLFLQKSSENYKLNQKNLTEDKQQKLQLLQNFQSLIKQLLKETVKIYLHTALKEVVQMCIDQLQTLNSIPQKFRIHGKEMPTTPSNICSNILMNLQNFLQKNQFDKNATEMIKEEVICQVYLKFLSLEKDIIQSSEKSHQIMLKLSKNNNKNNNTTTNQYTEVDKIKKQFELDKQELQQIIQSKYGINDIENLAQEFQLSLQSHISNSNSPHSSNPSSSNNLNNNNNQPQQQQQQQK